MSDHGNKSFALTRRKTDNAASSKMHLVACRNSTKDSTDHENQRGEQNDNATADTDSERHTNDVTNTP